MPIQIPRAVGKKKAPPALGPRATNSAQAVQRQPQRKKGFPPEPIGRRTEQELSQSIACKKSAEGSLYQDRRYFQLISDPWHEWERKADRQLCQGSDANQERQPSN